MNCDQCKTPLPPDAAFCPNCGAKPGSSAAPSSSRGVKTFSGLGTIAPMRESRTSVLDAGTMFDERYEVVRKLGEGGMGVVYVANDTRTGREIVLKLIHPDLVTGEEAVKRLMAEGLTAQNIRHPNVVAVFDVSQSNGQPYFTMEFVKGGTLRSWMVNHISSGTDVKLETAVGIIRSMLKGLGEAHRMNVVHRDLKPENVLLCGNPDDGDFNLKILDFGIAKAIDAPRSSGSGGAIGTPLYMAPEQSTSADVVGVTADIYSLSAMFFELLMDAPPQGGGERIGSNRPDVPKAIDDLIHKGLSRRAKSRQASVADFQAELDAAMGEGGPGPTPDPIRPDPIDPPPIKRDPPPPIDGRGPLDGISTKTKMWAGVGVVVVVLAVIGSLNGTPDDPPAIADDFTTADEETVVRPGGDVVRPAAFNASGTWRDQVGNLFEVQHDGNTFTGRGNVPGTGTVLIRGTLTASGASISISSGPNTIFQGTGSVGPGTGGIDVTFSSFMFHINH